MKQLLEDMVNEGKIKVDNSSKNQDYLRTAYDYAEDNSMSVTTWTSAIIERDGTVLSKGANRFPKGIIINDERLIGIKREKYMEHAERNAIYSAARDGIKLEGSSLYMAWLPCCPCANAMTLSGIKELIFHYDMAIKTIGDWKPDIVEAFNILLETGTKVKMYQGKIGNCLHMYKKDIWQP